MRQEGSRRDGESAESMKTINLGDAEGDAGKHCVMGGMGEGVMDRSGWHCPIRAASARIVFNGERSASKGIPPKQGGGGGLFQS